MKYKVLKDFISPYNLGVFKVGEAWGIAEDARKATELVVSVLLKHGFIEEIKDEPWEPKEGEPFYWLTSSGYIMGSINPDYSTIVRNASEIKIGNCFRTEEQAQKAVEWLKAFKVLRDDTKGFKPDWNGEGREKWTVYYDSGEGGLDTHLQFTTNDSLIYFATEADAKESISNHEKEWRQFLSLGDDE